MCSCTRKPKELASRLPALGRQLPSRKFSARASMYWQCDSWRQSACPGGRLASCGEARMLLQLADFLTPRVDAVGGCMALPDVYCLFNRARGSELVSPDDLLQVGRCCTARAQGRSRTWRTPARKRAQRVCICAREGRLSWCCHAAALRAQRMLPGCWGGRPARRMLCGCRAGRQPVRQDRGTSDAAQLPLGRPGGPVGGAQRRSGEASAGRSSSSSSSCRAPWRSVSPVPAG